jgi:acyl transferase domain-containing protein/acyl carrier protein
MADFLERISNLSPKKLALLANDLKERFDSLEQERREPIAIVGMGCRFPGGADSPAEFWRLLHDGVDAISEVPPERWDLDSIYDPEPGKPGKISSRYGGFLKDVDRFDPAFFGISPREATSMDPQQRLLLEVVWEALEDAGQSPEMLSETQTGVFVGIAGSDYLHGMLECDPKELDMYTATGGAHSTASGRISYILGLRGPSMSIDTACSSSLVALHLACQSLRTKESKIAIAAGVNLILKPEVSISLSRSQMLAPDGRCKTFDASGDGFVRSEGCGVVVLKRLSDAVANRDCILALVSGTAVNQDGRSSGLTAPNGPSQEAVIQAALTASGVEPAAVDYIETHGTGTSLGDPIEVRALGKVFSPKRDSLKPLNIGSVKTNLGHLETAAGIAGLIKTVLALRNEEIPPSLHFKNPSPHIPWDQYPVVRVAAESKPWKRGSRRRLAGVSSFGFSGTNVHAVLEEAPQQASPNQHSGQQQDRPAHIYTVSAKSEAALLENVKRHLAALRTESSLANACFTANAGRTHFAHRFACVSHSREELVEQLEAYVEGEMAPGVVTGQVQGSAATEVVFLFPGQGAQFPGMTRKLYNSEPVFRAALDKCAHALDGVLKRPLLDVIFSGSEETAIHDPEYAQPANFAVEYAVSEMWRSWGVTPSIVVGHSLGEFGAACVAGICDPVEAIRLVATRGRLMQELPPNGAMVAVYAPEQWVAEKIAKLGQKVSICAMNHPEQTVISGPHAGIEAAFRSLETQGIKVEWLRAYHGYHSREMQPMVEELVLAAGQVQYRMPQLQFVSTLTGKLLPAGETLDPDYWGRQVVEPVRFVAAVETLRELHYNVFLDTGPAPVLGGNGRHCYSQGTWLATLRPSREDWDQIHEALCGLYTAGVAIDWEAFHRSYQRQRIALPTYAFERQSYWILEPEREQTARIRAVRAGAAVHRLLGVRLDHPIPTFETTVDRMRIPGLGAHKIGQTEVVPGPVYFEMALAAASQALGVGKYQLEDLVLKEALLFDNSEQTIQAVVTKDADETSTFQLCSPAISGDSGKWRTHAVARLRPAPEMLPCDLELEQVRERCAEPASLDSLREQLQMLAVEIPALDFVDGAWKGSSEVLTHLSLGAEQAQKGSDFLFDPVAMDAALLSFAVMLSAQNDGAPEGSFFLAGVDRVIVQEQPGDKLWSYARLTSSEDGPAKSRTGDLFLYGETGKPVAILNGLHFKQASKLTKAAAQPEERLEGDWLYQLQWERTAAQPDSASAQSAATPSSTSASWIVFAGADDAGKAISDSLRQRDQVRATVAPGQAYSAQGNHFTVNPRSAQDFERAIREASGGSPSEIAFLWGMDGTTFSADGGAVQAVTEVCLSLSRLVEGAAAAKTGARIWLVTQGAQAIGNTGRPLACAQSALWGLGRAAALEESALWGGLIDLDPEKKPEEQAAWILASAACADGEDQVAIRDGVRLAARLTRLSPKAAGRVDIGLEGSYLVTGGLGAVGVKVARWLVERGARHVVLVGRRGLPNRSLWADIDLASANGRSVAAVNALEAMGARIEIVAADLADRSSVENMFASFGREWPELRGLVHAAVAAPEERGVRELDQKALSEMLSVKVDGTRNLLDFAAGQPVEFIVFFSSMAALLGLRGGGHYAAASEYLDALAHNCRRSGLPVTTIDWGAWDEMRSSSGEIRRLARTENASVYPLDPPKALATMESVVAAGLPQAAIAAIHWENLRSLHESERPRPLIQGLTSAAKGAPASAGNAGAGDLRARLSAASESERLGILEAFVRSAVARVLGVRNPESIDARKGLFEMGLDSLMSIDLKTRLANGAGHSLPSTLAFNYPSIAALTGFLAQDMFPAAVEEHAIAEPEPSIQTDPDANGVAVGEMSEDELAERLRKRLAQLAGVKS